MRERGRGRERERGREGEGEGEREREGGREDWSDIRRELAHFPSTTHFPAISGNETPENRKRES